MSRALNLCIVAFAKPLLSIIPASSLPFYMNTHIHTKIQIHIQKNSQCTLDHLKKKLNRKREKEKTIRKCVL